MNLGLLQIADSALPISGYTHSWGLETAVSRALVHDPATLENWTRQWLQASLGPLEGVLVANACRAGHARDTAALAQLNELAEVSLVPPTIYRASREMGEQLIALGLTWQWCADPLTQLLPAASTDDPPTTHRGWHHPVAFGLLGALAGAQPAEVLSAYLHQAALGMITAGVRAIPVGHTHGQQILAYLHHDLVELVSEIVDREPQSAGAGCPSYEIFCDEQTRLYARMFRS